MHPNYIELHHIMYIKCVGMRPRTPTDSVRHNVGASREKIQNVGGCRTTRQKRKEMHKKTLKGIQKTKKNKKMSKK